MKQTPLYENHRQLGGKIVDFGGWALPVQYSGILEEHEAVRTRAGLFDVSHMGELLMQGPAAQANLQNLLTNDLSLIQIGQCLYSPMCAPDGGTVDDLLVYRLSEMDWLLVVNATNTDADEAWIRQRLIGNVQMINQSADYGQLAIQGPNAERILQRLADVELGDIRFYRFRQNILIGGVPALVSRTGYTGEDGFEIYLPASETSRVWDRLLEEGQADGLIPAGLGARDTLRFEASLPLYGQELSRDITPLEAGLGRFVKLEKSTFIGREALVSQLAAGVPRHLVGLEMIERGVARCHYEIQAAGQPAGHVTSGSFSPSLKKNIALALVESRYAEPGTPLDVIIRGKAAAAQVIALPFYRRQNQTTAASIKTQEE